MQIHKGKLKDLKEICRLYEVLFTNMAELQSDYIKVVPQDENFIKMVINDNNYDIFLAEENNTLLGFVIVQEMKTREYKCIVPHNYSYIIDIVVDTNSRSHGIGKLLLEEVKTWSKNRNLEYVELSVLSNNYRAIKLYENFGFNEYQKNMKLHL